MEMKTIESDFAYDAVILGNGSFPEHPIPQSILHSGKPVICCDGSVGNCVQNGVEPTLIIGDGDSIPHDLREKYSPIFHLVPDQETNDQTKAVEYLRERHIRQIVLIGACGKREDHTLGNISLLISYLKKGVEARIYTDYGMFIPVCGPASFEFPVASKVSVFSFGTRQMQSKGLAYPLRDFHCWWEGTLNHSTENPFQISCKGYYLVYINYL